MSLPRRWPSMSRTCARMGISSRKAPAQWSNWGSKQAFTLAKQKIAQSLRLSIVCFLVSCFLTSCTAVRPVVKIGLLAPFEGLHRRTGYAALTAMRQAIAEAAPAEIAIMPLALDDGADPAQVERATRKLLQDPAIRALVGPYSPFLAQPIAPLMAASGLAWWRPFAVTPSDGFSVAESKSDWAEPLLAAAAEQAVALGGRRLVLAGWTPGWPTLQAEQLGQALAMPVLISDAVAIVEPADAVFWLGSAEMGAVYLTALRAYAPPVPFLLGPQAADPIFAEHAQLSGPVYLLFWLDDGYEQWQRQQRTAPPIAYLTYRATQQAIAQMLGQPLPQRQSWRIAAVPVDKAAVP